MLAFDRAPLPGAEAVERGLHAFPTEALPLLARLCARLQTVATEELAWRLARCEADELEGAQGSVAARALVRMCGHVGKARVALLLASARGLGIDVFERALACNQRLAWHPTEVLALLERAGLVPLCPGYVGGGFMSGSEALQETRNARAVSAATLGRACRRLLASPARSLSRGTLWHQQMLLTPELRFGDTLALLTADDPSRQASGPAAPSPPSSEVTLPELPHDMLRAIWQSAWRCAAATCVQRAWRAHRWRRHRLIWRYMWRYMCKEG